MLQNAEAELMWLTKAFKQLSPLQDAEVTAM